MHSGFPRRVLQSPSPSLPWTSDLWSCLGISQPQSPGSSHHTWVGLPTRVSGPGHKVLFLDLQQHFISNISASLPSPTHTGSSTQDFVLARQVL